MKIVTIVGARPQFVKAAALSRALKDYPSIREIIVHTGQHHDVKMSDVFFEEMNIPEPHYHLEVSGLGHGAMTGRMLEKIEEVLIREKPDWVLVYGDTNSTIAGALAASKLHIRVAHVEAGLRSFNMKMPEEINRILTDRVSDLLFCPTDVAVKNLSQEGIKRGVVRTGDIMADAFYFYRKVAAEKASLFRNPPVGKFALATIHRAENTDSEENLKNIFRALDEVQETLPVILPIHPRTKARVEALKIQTTVRMTDPVGYFDMLQLLSHSSLVLTDSGGLQKEAYLAGKPCVTLREETEWVELVENKVNLLAGTSPAGIVGAAKELLQHTPVFPPGLYGDGNAAHQIIDAVLAF